MYGNNRNWWKLQYSKQKDVVCSGLINHIKTLKHLDRRVSEAYGKFNQVQMQTQVQNPTRMKNEIEDLSP